MMEIEKKLLLILRMIRALIEVIEDELREKVRRNESRMDNSNREDNYYIG